MVRNFLPPGFRFHPTDVELVLYYLKRKILGKKFHYEAIAEVNIYKFSPWDLPAKSCLKSKDLEWFFFCPREKKYSSGARVKRATENGYWKTTGKDRTISFNEKTIGTVKTLVFHLGHAPQGERTDWVIHEFRILDDQLAKDGVQDNYVLCKLFKKNGPGPKNGAQYGAPFNEADWDDDNDEDVSQNCPFSLVTEGPCRTVLMPSEEQSVPVGSDLLGSGNGSLPIVVEAPSSSAVAPTSMVAVDDTNDEISRILASFADEEMLLSNGNGTNLDDFSGNGLNKLLHPSEGLNIYNGLGDLDSWTEGGYDPSGLQNVDYSLNNMLPDDNSTYLELDDLLAPMDCSNGVTETHISSLCQSSVPYNHENIHQVYSPTMFAGMDQYTPFVNNLAVLPGTSEVDNSLDALQMMDHPFYQGSNALYNLDLPFGQLENAHYSPHNMERGSHLENRYSRFMECIPAHLPSAAELLALSFSRCGGSSIHIKAEVTHGAGECTNEALSVMVGESSSCWCNLLFRKIQLWVVGVLNLGSLELDFMVSALIKKSRAREWDSGIEL
ncbi:hypothetical protein C2S53_009633 [Perilla frutescens var. hirtella]|uniref:NAC domain-containing protein n=1 Tax=Perilla frutescens var. hirtella TaxID=608512 RepID=A0AAD4NX75_PERFH|nr:hypothetical protein C2S53_009633 [Perilla frutescens var. hirtella]